MIELSDYLLSSDMLLDFPSSSNKFVQIPGQIYEGSENQMPVTIDAIHRKALLQKIFELLRAQERIPSNATHSLDITKLQIGDLILKMPTKPTLLQIAIQQGQALEYPATVGEHWLYTHAMICRGGDEVYESNAENGVHRNTFWSHMGGNNTFKVLRLRNKSQQNRSQIALNAAELTGQQYDYKGASFASLKVFKRYFPYRKRGDNSNTFFCSSLFAAACYYEQIDLGIGGYDDKDNLGPNPRFVSPAALSNCNALEAINVDLVVLSDYL